MLFANLDDVEHVVAETASQIADRTLAEGLQKKARKWLAKREDCAHLLGPATQLQTGKLRPTHRFHCSTEAARILAGTARYMVDALHQEDQTRLDLLRHKPWNLQQLWEAHVQRWVQQQRQSVAMQEAVFAPDTMQTHAGRYWRRVTSLGELHDLGESMRNCLTAHYDDYFKMHKAEIWYLTELQNGSGQPLAAVAIDLTWRPVSIRDAEAPNSEWYDGTPIPPAYGSDLRELISHRNAWGIFVELARTQCSDKIVHLGLFGMLDVEADEPEFVLEASPPIRAWRLGSAKGNFLYLYQPGHGFAEIRLYDAAKPGATLEGVATMAADRLGSSAPGLRWLGRTLERLFTKRPKIDASRILRDLPDFVDGTWWADAPRFSRTLKSAHRRPMCDSRKTFWLFANGVTLTHPTHDSDNESPVWLVQRGERNSWTNTGLLPRHHEVLRDKTFWNLLDASADQVGFLARIQADRFGQPRSSWAPIHADGQMRWAAPSHGWSAPQGFEVPDGAGFRLRLREVLDWESLDWKAGSGLRVTRQRLPVAWQIMAFADGKRRGISGALLRRSTPKHERYTLFMDAPGLYPDVVAALVTAAESWCDSSRVELEWTNDALEPMAARDGAGSSTVAFTLGSPRLTQPPRGLEGSGWRKAEGYVFGYDGDGKLLWLARVSGPALSPRLGKPTFVAGISPRDIEAHAIAVVVQGGFRASGAWRRMALEQGFWMADDGVLTRGNAGRYTALRAGACVAKLCPAEAGTLRWGLRAPVLRWRDDDRWLDDDGNEDESESAGGSGSVMCNELLGHVEIAADGGAQLHLTAGGLHMVQDDGNAQQFCDEQSDYLPANSVDGLRRIYASLVGGFGAKPSACDLGWLGLKCHEGKLTRDEAPSPGLVGDVEIPGTQLRWLPEYKDHWILEGPMSDPCIYGTWDGLEVTLQTQNVQPQHAAAATAAILEAAQATHDGSSVIENHDVLELTVTAIDPGELDGVDFGETQDEPEDDDDDVDITDDNSDEEAG